MAYGVRICCLCEAEGSAKIGARTWRWEYHSYLGPTFVDKDGNSVKCPPENHPVWNAFNDWLWEHLKAKKDTRGLGAMAQWYKPRPAVGKDGGG